MPEADERMRHYMDVRIDLDKAIELLGKRVHDEMFDEILPCTLSRMIAEAFLASVEDEDLRTLLRNRAKPGQDF